MSEYYVEAIRNLAKKRDDAIDSIDALGNDISEQHKSILKTLPVRDFNAEVAELIASIPQDSGTSVGHTPPLTSGSPATPLAPAAKAAKTTLVTPDAEPRSKRACSRTNYGYGKDYEVQQQSHSTRGSAVDVTTSAEEILTKSFKWKKVNHFGRHGDTVKYINPNGNYCEKKKYDAVEGEDYFFDAQKALAFAKLQQKK